MNNHITAVFSPDKNHTRHSEGAFLRLKDGGILFIYSRFTGSVKDDAPSDLVKCVSYDEGESWSTPDLCIPASFHGVENIMSVSLLRMRNGDIGLFYSILEKTGNTTVMLSRSDDEGEHFKTHIRCSLDDRPGYYVLNNDRVERVADGRLLMPLTYHRRGRDEITGKKYFDYRGFGCWLLSDDDGYHWHEAADTVYPPFTGSVSGLQESGAVEKKNGVIWGYFRTDRGCQYESFSTDRGEHWTVPQASRFTSPCSPMKLKYAPSGELYAVWNPIPNYIGRRIDYTDGGRTPLCYAVSRDDGVSWSEPQTVEEKSDHGYCYPALFFTGDDALLIAYCRGGPENGKSCLAELTIQKCRLLS